MIQKSYDGSPSLYLIPTPIGNMEDMTLRAIRMLKEVDVIFAEDTRVAKQLLDYFEISKKLISNHQYNEERNKSKVVEFLKDKKNVGLITDRGTPIISDPGYEIVRYVISQGFNVISLPGATAFTPALVSSGLPPMPFIFYGFLNSKEVKRKKELFLLKDVKFTIIFYESIHRIDKMLKDVLEVFGNRQISISREITKKYEEIYRGLISDAKVEVQKGEFVIVVEGVSEVLDDSLNIEEHINLYLAKGNSLKEAMKNVAKERKTSKSNVYKEYHK